MNFGLDDDLMTTLRNDKRIVMYSHMGRLDGMCESLESIRDCGFDGYPIYNTDERDVVMDAIEKVNMVRRMIKQKAGKLE